MKISINKRARMLILQVRIPCVLPMVVYLCIAYSCVINASEPTDGPWQLTRSWTGHSMLVSAIAVSDDGMRIATGSFDKVVKVWEAETGELIHTLDGHKGSVGGVAFSEDGKILASGCWSRLVRTWDATSGELIRDLESDASVWGVALSPDGGTLVAAGNHAFVWETSGGELKHKLKLSQRGGLSCVAISRDGRRLLGASSRKDGTIDIWDASNGELLRTLSGHDRMCRAVAITHDGKTIVSAGEDKTARVWNADTGETLRVLQGHKFKLWNVACSGDAKVIVTASFDSTSKVWDGASGEVLQTMAGFKDSVMCCAITPDGNTIVLGGEDKTIRVYRRK